MKLKRDRLEALLSRMQDLHVLVVGDLAVDAYWYVDMTRSVLARETPRFVRPVYREKYSLGAGANVASNAKALGVGTVSVVSAIGDDWRGEILQRLLRSEHIETEHLSVGRDWNTMTFVKPILRGHDTEQEDTRIDFENFGPIPPHLEDRLISTLEKLLPRCQVVLIADQSEVGEVVSERVRNCLNDLADAYPQCIFVADSRCRIERFNGVYLKPNTSEALTAVGVQEREPDLALLSNAGRELARLAEHPVFVTRSEKGMLLCETETVQEIETVALSSSIDPVGAGDTASAALGAMMAAGASPLQAGIIANIAASVTVKKTGITGTANPEEILERYDEVQQDA